MVITGYDGVRWYNKIKMRKSKGKNKYKDMQSLGQ